VDLPDPPPRAAPKSAKLPLIIGGGLLLACALCLVGIWQNEFGRAFIEGFATGAFEKAAPADVRQPKTHSGSTCSFRYPGNWDLAPDPDFGPERAFDISAPAQGSVNIYLLPPDTHLPTMVEAMVAEFESQPLLIQNPRRHPLRGWGSHEEAEGVELRGLMALMPARIRVASFATEKGAVVICEIRFDEDERMAKPGFDLIAESFELGEVKD